jgi:hypothetical protein
MGVPQEIQLRRSHYADPVVRSIDSILTLGCRDAGDQPPVSSWGLGCREVVVVIAGSSI